MIGLNRRLLLGGISTLGIIACMVSAPKSFAQTGGTSGGATSLGTIGSGGTGGGGTSGGGSSAGGSSSLQSSPFSRVSGSSGGSGGTGGSTVDQTNFLSTTFSNPLYEGRPNQSINNSATASGSGTTQSASQPGGFGQSSFGNTSSTGTTRGGLGASGGSLAATASQTSTTRVAYSTVVKFPVRPMAPNQLQSDLSDIINRSSTIKNPAGIRVFVQDQAVVLRGRVNDDDERRLVEGMIRLTPGVRNVVNELEVP